MNGWYCWVQTSRLWSHYWLNVDGLEAWEYSCLEKLFHWNFECGAHWQSWVLQWKIQQCISNRLEITIVVYISCWYVFYRLVAISMVDGCQTRRNVSWCGDGWIRIQKMTIFLSELRACSRRSERTLKECFLPPELAKFFYWKLVGRILSSTPFRSQYYYCTTVGRQARIILDKMCPNISWYRRYRYGRMEK